MAKFLLLNVTDILQSPTNSLKFYNIAIQVTKAYSILRYKILYINIMQPDYIIHDLLTHLSLDHCHRIGETKESQSNF